MVALWAVRVSCLQGKSTLAPCCSREQKMFLCKTLPIPFTPAQSSATKIPLLTQLSVYFEQLLALCSTESKQPKVDDPS